MLFTPGSYQEGKKYALEKVPGMSCGARQQRPYSAGYVRLRSPRPEDDPLIQPNYLADPRDRKVIVRALKLARRLMATKAMAPYFDHETLPGAKVASDDEWLDFARRRGSTAYHLVGTCKMGPHSDRMAVVDPQPRVHGMVAATLMVAEKAADLIARR